MGVFELLFIVGLKEVPFGLIDFVDISMMGSVGVVWVMRIGGGEVCF